MPTARGGRETSSRETSTNYAKDLVVASKIDPRDLSVNLRFRGKQVLHPRARAAMAKLAEDVATAVQEQGGWEPCNPCRASLVYWFPTRRSDIDGPVKRTLDSVERGLKSIGIRWNDLRIVDLRVTKGVLPKAGFSTPLMVRLEPVGGD